MSTSSTQMPCPPRYYLNRTQGRSQDDCAVCPAGKYCTIGTSVPMVCPQGYYCITGTSEPEPCPLGTFGNSTGLKMMEDCFTCLPGMYCDGTALTNPSGPCDAGFYCTGGSYTSAPSGSAGTIVYQSSGQYVGGLCNKGGYCPLGSSTSIPCPTGTYNNATGAQSLSECTSCPPGYYCEGNGLSLPTDVCAAGYYCTSGAQTPTQYESPIGYFSAAGAYSPSACPPGTYNNQVRQSQCPSCPPRFYCNNTATIQPAVCPQGYYCPLSTALPLKCPAGTYSNMTGLGAASECLTCPPGSYCQTSGLVQPSGPCLAGYVCTGGATFPNPNGQSFGTVCPVGSYCPSGSALPFPCPLGTYRPNTLGQNITDCTPSPGGTYSNATGLVAPTGVCASGYYCTLQASTPTPTDGTTGNICPIGYYCPQGSPLPLKCVEGTYSGSVGLTQCTQCPAGSYCNGVSTGQYLPCPAGYYCPQGTTSHPLPCPIGSFNNYTGIPSIYNCTVCTPGSYCSQTALTQPSGPCQQGFFCNAGSVNPFGQTTSQLVNGTLSANASLCTAGYYCPTGTYIPIPCPVGTYLPALGGQTMSSCLLCPPGKYCNSTGATVPSGSCSPGYYCQLNNNVAQPTLLTISNGTQLGGGICPVGTYCPGGSSTPLACVAGTYSISVGASQCRYYCPNGTSDYTLYPCAKGYYCPQGTSYIDEYPCPKGTYSNQTGLQNVTQCVFAPGGMYVDVVGAISPGSYTATPTGQTNAFGVIGNQCHIGSYCPEGSSNPVPCPLGTYGSSLQLQNQSSCTTCDPGYICPTSGLTNSTLLCPPGSYCPGGQYSGSQNYCPVGSFCPSGSIVPQPCPAGTFNNNTGQASCQICPARYYCLANSTAPLPCPPGYYCPVQTQYGTQFPCLSGTFSNSALLQSSNECLDCPPGQYCSGLPPTNVSTGFCSSPYFCSRRATSPRPNDTSGGLCSAGYVCLDGASIPNPTDNVTGYACPAGKYCPPGSPYPLGCSPGTYSPLLGAGACLGCQGGFYCPQNTSVPVVCPVGSFCPQNSSQPLPCPIGTYSNNTSLVSAAQCPMCPPAYYCNSTGLIQPSGLCLAGYICTGVNSTFGSICPPGKYCPEGSAIGTPCPLGTYRPNNQGQSVNDCSPSPGGTFTYATGLLAPTGICAPGYYCSLQATTSSPTDGTTGNICPIGYYCPQGSTSPLWCSWAVTVYNLSCWIIL
ncbi:hypothetical protein THRCLA_21431 [Thraustotheca clavata]|uniref:Uncharacterized protein n=1 Tax=Thraustotheca clavata TaxID=74557 RepID=A0A1V9ZWI3_9STRA|nr:hypothetical protein THRCLA_21431 [Thraustotheca clavata]